MIWKYAFFVLFALLFITASDPYFGIELSFQPLPKEKADEVRELSWQSTDVFRHFLEDRDGRINKYFKVTPYYFPMVQFWFLIYTQFDSNQVVIHDKNNMSLIYKVLDFSSLHKKKLTKNIIHVLRQKISDEKLTQLRKDLDFLENNPASQDEETKILFRTFAKSGITVPSGINERKKFFQNLKNGLRSQTGQRNFIRDGIVRSLPYQPFLAKYFLQKRLPKELLAIPFLESSFNPLAHSKVNALGVWQFMPLIASYFVPTRGIIDYRYNIGVASVSASFLMAENYQILKSWDLAVTAYNSGTKHLLKTKRELGHNFVKLEDVIKHSDSRHFGFASKNFYSEFLALAHTLAYKEEIFKDLHEHDRQDVNKDLQFFILKCNQRLDKILTKLQTDDILFHNHHITVLNSVLPRGAILTTKTELPVSKFQRIDNNALLKRRPKDWPKDLNQSCSTR